MHWPELIFPVLAVSVHPLYRLCAWVLSVGYWLGLPQFVQVSYILRPVFKSGRGCIIVLRVHMTDKKFIA